MSALEALILGAVQGLTEFLPVSSDGHLTLVPFFLGWDSPSLAFIVAAHIGTLIAAVWVFKEEVQRVLRTLIGWKAAGENDRLLVKLLVIGSIPAAIAGVLLEDLVEGAVQRPVLAAFMLGVTAWWLFSSEKKAAVLAEDGAQAHPVGTKDALAIGLVQATAILPGISRSGMTIGMAMRRGIDRETAARFSFVLGIPIIAGAIVFQIPDMLDEGIGGESLNFLLAIASSMLTGLFAIRALLSVVRARTLKPFGIYCVSLMIIALIVALAKG